MADLPRDGSASRGTRGLARPRPAACLKSAGERDIKAPGRPQGKPRRGGGAGQPFISVHTGNYRGGGGGGWIGEGEQGKEELEGEITEQEKSR